jgi:hypothetical protein
LSVDVFFSAYALGQSPLSWQWRLNGSPIPNSKYSSLTVFNVNLSDAGRYSVVVTDSLGSAISEDAVLSVIDALPSFTMQPESRTVNTGSYVAFTAWAEGSYPLSWQWLFNGGPILAATNSNFTIPNVTGNDAGNYSVVVSNSVGAVTSQVAVLTVVVPGLSPSITVQPVSQDVPVGGVSSLRRLRLASCRCIGSGCLMERRSRTRPTPV